MRLWNVIAGHNLTTWGEVRARHALWWVSSVCLAGGLVWLALHPVNRDLNPWTAAVFAGVYGVALSVGIQVNPWRDTWDTPPPGWFEHRYGIPWDEAPAPLKWHRCRPQTRGRHTTGTVPVRVERCRCGARRVAHGTWARKNSRKEKKHG